MRKKIVSVLCLMLMLMPIFNMTALAVDAVNAVNADPGVPEITVVAAKIAKDNALEIGLRINSKNIGYKSAGVVLSYDATKLRPWAWQINGEKATAANAESMYQAAKLTEEEAASHENPWSNGVNMAAQATEYQTGKNAMTVIDATGTVGYLYLETQAHTIDPDSNQAQDNAAFQENKLTDMGSMTGYGFDEAYVVKEYKEKVDQVITVRFSIVGPEDDGNEEEQTPSENENLEPGGNDTSESGADNNPAANSSLDGGAAEVENLFATYGIKVLSADDSFAKKSHLRTNYMYFAETDSYDIDCTLNALSISDGVSNNQGGGSTEDIVAVTAFDWDGEMLGSFIFQTDANPEVQRKNAQAALDDFIKEEEVAKTLKEHEGYDFLDWVKNKDDVPSSYGWRTPSAAKGTTEELALKDADKVDFGTLKTSTTVKAAYTTNDKIELGDKVTSLNDKIAARNYQSRIVGYGRFGASDNFSITIEVNRGNVPRVTNGYLWVRTRVGDVDNYSRYALKGSDTEEVQVALYAVGARGKDEETNEDIFDVTGVSLVEWTVIDDYEYSNWVDAGTAGERSDRATNQAVASGTIQPNVGTSRNVAVWAKDSYPCQGVVAGIYDQLLEKDKNNTSLTVTANHLRSIGIAPSDTNNNRLRNNIYDNWVRLGKPKLTWDILNDPSFTAAAPTT